MGHHYVPRFYLKNFAFNEEKTLVYSMTKEGKIPEKPSQISNICSKKNYNTPDQEREQFNLENRHAEVLREFIKEVNPVEIHLAFSDELLEFVSFMVGNNIFVREKLDSVYTLGKIRQNGVELDNNIIVDNGYRRKLDWSIAFSGRTYKEFQNWMWELVRLDLETSRKHFITSDNPVSIFNPEDIFTPINVKLEHDGSKTKAAVSHRSEGGINMEVVLTLTCVSFGQNAAMIFPLTPKLCLIGFSDSSRYNSYKEVSKNRLIEFVNLMTLYQCNKAVYSHSKELLMKTWANMPRFLDHCDSNNAVIAFKINIL